MPLSPSQQDTLDRIEDLRTLPGGPWRVHAGDLPHGESPALDDSSWPEANPHSTAPKEAVWYRRVVEVPKTLHGYDLTGVSVSFQFFAFTDGPMPEIVYYNGRRVALGEDLDAITLFSDAKPGDKILIAVKLLPTPAPKKFYDALMRISFASNRPNPADTRDELVSAANLVPSLAPDSSSDRRTLLESIDAVDTSALDRGDQRSFDDSLRKSVQLLTALRPLEQQVNYNLTGNSHIDAAWLWPWTETVDTVKRTFGTAVQLMQEYPTYTYSQSAAVYNQWMADKYPFLNAEIAQRVKEGRWELVGGMWLEPDLNMPDGESLVRQILVGQATFKKLYGATTRVGWNPDSFGYNWQLPQIYKRSGIDYFVTQKMSWNDTNQLPLKLFWWESPDGSKILTYFPHRYDNGGLNPDRLSKDMLVARNRAPGLMDMLDLYGVGDHGGGPTRDILDESLKWMEADKVVPKSEFRTAQPYFSKVESKLNLTSPTWNYASLAKGNVTLPAPNPGQISVPTWKDELYLEFHRGVFTTQANHKRNMRDSEEWVLNAEKYASFAWLDGQQYPASKLTDAWKLVLFNQFHDLAAGTGISEIYADAQKDYDQVHATADEISRTSIATLSSRIDTRVHRGVPVIVFNPLAWRRGGPVQVSVQLPSGPTSQVTVLDSRNHVVPSELLSHDPSTHGAQILLHPESIPSLGYEVFHVVEGERSFPSDLKSSGTTLENATLKVVIDPHTGCITSLFNKRSNFETLAPNSCGNELQAFKDTPKAYDAWNVDPGTFDVSPALIHEVDSVHMTESGPLRSTIRITRHWQNSRFTQDITLYSGSDHVSVAADIDWHETHVLLKVAFPLSATSANATYEIPYGTIERPTTRNNSWEKSRFEVPAMRWADLGNPQHGFSLINNSKYGYDSVGNLLRLTLLRSPASPDPGADRGEQRVSYELYPHAGTWQQAATMQHGYNDNYNLKATQVEAHEGNMPSRHSFLSTDSDHVVVTAVKKAEDSNALIVRFFEWAGEGGEVTLILPPGAIGATLTNLMEASEGGSLTVSEDHVTVPVTPYQIQTVKVRYEP